MRLSHYTAAANLVLLATLTLVLSPYLDARERSMEERLQERRDFRQRREEEFAQFVEERWQALEEFRRERTFKEDKFTEAPQYTPREEETQELERIERTEISEPDPEPVPAAPPEEDPAEPEPEPEVERPTETEEKTNWYGDQVIVPELSSPLPAVTPNQVDESAAADYLEKFEAAPRSELSEAIDNVSSRLNLQGWHELYFIYFLAGELTDTAYERRLLSWAIAQQRGLDVRLAMDDSDFFLIYYSPRSMPGTSYYTLNGREYYIFLPKEQGKPEGAVRTYAADNPNVERAATPYVDRLPELPWREATRTLNFNFDGQNYSFDLNYNDNLAEYFETVPQVEPEYYFKSLSPVGVEESFLETLDEEIKNMSTWTALDFLLRLTQKGFEYKTDVEQFGRQWFMIPADTTNHPYSDCDDRAIFYAWLVRELLGLEVAGALWPGHLSTAVEFPDRNIIDGTYVMIDDTPYVLNDPTYIGAGPGRVMEQLRGQTPEILLP